MANIKATPIGITISALLPEPPPYQQKLSAELNQGNKSTEIKI
ncbi:hypothetical protein CCACVL1_04179 [Corchorus capsularis]|uniref:Uncharacterized protein n=1 Tax=Corchorus capsularis TaxID=210143 RepID=A0A1R3JUW5_COCAP|nr:hypothetical protein CCACVL1_04179 [Corchorus capsularis]